MICSECPYKLYNFYCLSAWLLENATRTTSISYHETFGCVKNYLNKTVYNRLTNFTGIGVHWLSYGLHSFGGWEDFSTEWWVLLRICYRPIDSPQRPIYGLYTHSVVRHELCHMMSPQIPWGHKQEWATLHLRYGHDFHVTVQMWMSDSSQ